MKRLIPLFLLLALSLKVSAQQPVNSDQAEFMFKLEKAKSLRSRGAALTIGGGVLLGVGIIVGLNSSETTTYNNNTVTQQSSTGNLALAELSFIAGNACLGVGIPLWIIGSNRVKNLDRQQRVSISVSPAVNGLTLRCRF
ncbi:MAG TPA: hypothetical protein DGG95_03910 [Cytophagales bacterium]|jgi:hypothetical protein|nr:hypothetical protein [Cytophagales bacterium]